MKAILALLIIACPIGYAAYLFASHTPAPTKKLTCTATQLVRMYIANEVAADLQAKGAELLVSGTVTQIHRDILGTPYITLDGGDAIREVQCIFDESHAGEMARVREGDRVTIRGRGEGLMMNVIVEDCSLDRIEHPPVYGR